MKDIGHSPATCEKINGVLSRIGDKWSLLIMIALNGRGVMRFNELKRHLGISQRMLSLTLRELERDGLITRTAFATVPPTVEYEMTDLGRSFAQAVRKLGEWGIAHLAEIDAARLAYDQREVSQ